MGWSIAILVAASTFLWSVWTPRGGLRFVLATLPLAIALNPAPGLDLQLIRLTVPAFAAGVFVRRPQGFVRSLQARPGLAWGAFLAVATLGSLCLATSPTDAIRKLAYFWSLSLLLPAVATAASEEQAPAAQISTPLFLGGALAAVVGIGQFMAQFVLGTDGFTRAFVRLAPVIHGNAFGDLITAYPSWFVRAGGTDWLRLFGLFPDPHVAALYFSFLATAALTLALRKTANRPAYIALTATFALVTLLTFSRGGYLGLTLGFSLALVFEGPSRTRTATLAIGTLALTLIAAAAAPFADRITSTFEVTEGSNAGRIAIWHEAADLARAHPFGVGVGNYALALGAREGSRTPANAHNLYLDVLTETGIPGLVAFAIFPIVTLAALLRRSREQNHLARGCAYGLAGMLTHATFENPLYAPAVLSLMLITGALASVQKRTTPDA